MEKRTSRQDWIRSKLPAFVLILCLIQPLLDIAGFWQVRLHVSNTVTMALRMLLLGGTVLLGFCISRRKRIYIITGLLLAVFTVCHALACMSSPNGYREALKDVINLVRIYFLPLMTLCFITFLQAEPKVFPAMRKAMVLDILIIALVQLVSTLTGTDPHTYSVDSIGTLGWFMWTNSQSAILAMLAPITICWSMQRWKGKLLPLVLLTAIAEGTLYVLAPRLAYASLVGAGLGMAFCVLILNRNHWKQALCVALVTCLFVAAYPVSPTNARLNKNETRAEITDKKIKEMDIHIETLPPETETNPETVENPSETEKAPKPVEPKPTIILDESNAEKLEKLYSSQDIIWSMVDRFGRDKVFQIYNYTLDPTILSNTRIMKINFCHLVMGESGSLSKLFGLNLKELTHDRYNAESVLVTDNYDVENDLHGIYFLTGLVGLGLMLAFLLFFGLRALVSVVRRPKLCFTPTMCSFAIAYGLGLIHAYFTASVLRRNNASFYLALVLAGLWFLSRKEGEGTNQKNS